MNDWNDVEAALTGVLDRRWYTNHGPLARRLETECADVAGTKHAIVVTNPTIALIMLADALALTGEVILSAFSPPHFAQALQWAGLSPRFVDIDPATMGLDAHAAASAMGDTTSALLASSLADRAACPLGLVAFGAGDVGVSDPVLADLGSLGEDAGIGCILTDEDGLAARLRNIRSNYGAGKPVPVVRTANGRLSEIQAAMALLVPPTLRLRRIDRIVQDGRCLMPYAQEWLLLPRDEADRAELSASFTRAGRRFADFQLDPRALHCTRAARLGALGLLIDEKCLSLAGFAECA